MSKTAGVFFLLLFSTGALADDTVSLPSMTIFNDEVSELPTQTQFDRETLQAVEMPDLNNVLKSQPGVGIIQGSGQMMTGITMRGAGGSGQGLFTLDDVPLFGNFAGFFALSHYPLDALENVTVTHGLATEQQGSRTLGGAIHLHTRRFKDGENFLRLEGGSYATLREAAGGGLKTQAGDFSVVVGRSDVFDGISQARYGSERDDFGMTHASGNWVKDFGRGSLNASLYFVRSDEKMDGPGVLPNRIIGWVDDKKGQVLDETWVAQLRGEYDFTKYWNSSLQFGFTQDRQKMVTTLIKPFAISNQLFMLDWKNTHRLPLDENNQNQALIMWGINTQHQNTPNFSTSQTVISPNVGGELVIGEWKWNADARFDNGDVYGNHQVFSLGVNRSLLHNVNAWMKGGTGYRQPGVSELMNPVYGNQNLQGESNTGGEIGLSWHPLPKSEIKISGYYQNYQQLITLQSDSKTGLVRTNNVAEADVWGAELQTQHRWSARWESGLSYGYMSAVNPITHLSVPSRPEHQGVFWNEVQLLQPLKLRVELNVHGDYWFDVANQIKANTAPRINALLKYQLTPKTDLYVRGENLSNERTPEITSNFNFNGAAFYLGFRTGF